MMLSVFSPKIKILLILQLHFYKKVNTERIFSIFIGTYSNSAQYIYLRNIHLIYVARSKYSKYTQEKAPKCI